MQRRKNDAIYLGVLLVVSFAKLLPYPLGLRFFGLLGKVVFLVPSKDRTRTFDHLRFIYGDKWSEKRIERTAKAVYVNLGKNLYDALFFSRCNREQMLSRVSFDDITETRAAYERGKGLIAITAHIGCFEMLLHLFGHLGLNSFAIGSKLYDKRLDTLVAHLRSGENITYMHRTGSSRNVIRLLKQGKVFGVLVDQDTKVEGVFAHFMDHLAYTPSAPIRMALRFDIPIVVVTTYRKNDNTHHVNITGPLEVERSGDITRDIVLTTERINSIIGDAVARHPEQWVWMHRRWLHQPDQPKYANVASIEDYISNGQ